MELTSHELTLIKKVANNIGKKWHVDVEDLSQHLTLFLLESWRAVERWRKQTGDGSLYVSLRREAGKYCAKEKEKQLGEPIDKNNMYTVDVVKRVLPFIWEITEQAKGNMVGEQQTAMAVLADVSGAYYGMSNADRTLLELRFKDGLSYNDIGERYKIKPDAARVKVNRTLQKLTSKLAGPSSVWVREPKTTRYQAE